MTCRLELRKQVASCQSSEQEEQETEKPNFFKIELNKSMEGLCGTVPGDNTGLELIMQKMSLSPRSHVKSH